MFKPWFRAERSLLRSLAGGLDGVARVRARLDKNPESRRVIMPNLVIGPNPAADRSLQR